MALYFITGSDDKFAEVSAIVPGLTQLKLDLPEIQSLDAKEVIRAKLIEAMKHHAGEFIVEDTSLYLRALGDLPGPLIKWFLIALGNPGLYDLCDRAGDYAAAAQTVIGYARSPEDVHFFQGALTGTVVAPRGDQDFGWGPIFQPTGSELTFGELDRATKHRLSMRGLAARQLAEFLAG